MTPVCKNDVLTWRVEGVVDSGGTKHVDCTVPVMISPVAPAYSWVITKPDGTSVSGGGSVASIIADQTGTYSCTFTASASRECPPDDRVLGPVEGVAMGLTPVQLTFGGPDYHPIARDDGSGNYPTPHWKDNSSPPDDDNEDVGDHNIPVLYPRNTVLHLSGQFSVFPPDAIDGPFTLLGEAITSDGIYEFIIKLPGVNGTISFSDIPADRALVNTVQYYNPLTIVWTVQLSDGTTLDCLAETQHRVYVSLAQPLISTLYESLADVACRSSIGTIEDAAVFQSIYGDFGDRVVRRKSTNGFNVPDDIQMRYWNPTDEVCQTWQTMLAQETGNGSCKAWSELLYGTALVHGIFTPRIYLVETAYTDDSSTTCGGDPLGRGSMLVKNWSFAPNGSADVVCTPFTHLSSEVFDQMGAPAQGNINPPGGFYNHFIVQFQGQWYDPSYGTGPFANELLWENASIDGFGKCCFTGTSQVSVRKTNDTMTFEMVFTGQ